jgi:pimeloyl-ACP methyl ester carboxylesterase
MTATPAGPQLAYEDHGAGQPLVFLHGLTFDRSVWRPIIDRLDDRFRCIAVDMPGHGDSAGPPAPLDEIADKVHTLLEEMDAHGAVIIGHSIAASIASLYAATYPGVAGVVNVDQPLQLRDFAGFLRQMEPALRGPAFPAAFEPFRQSFGLDLVPEPLRSTVMARMTIDQDLVLGYWDEVLHADTDAVQARIDQLLDALTVPHLFVFGRELQPSERDYLLRHVRFIEIEEWVGDGHCVHLVEPERLADRIADFAAS